VLVARTFWLTMTEELDPILINFLLEVISNRNSGHTVTFIGTML
jgi:hypothetical protein